MRVQRLEVAPPCLLSLFTAAKGANFRAYYVANESSAVEPRAIFAMGQALCMSPESAQEDHGIDDEAILVGGSPFLETPSQNPIPSWAHFKESKMILPTILVACYADRAELQIAAGGKSADLDLIHAQYEELLQLENVGNAQKEDIGKIQFKNIALGNSPSSLSEHDILKAVQNIEDDTHQFQKVVLADIQLFKINANDVAADNVPETLISKLQNKYSQSDCTIFALGFSTDGNEEVFFGASPELLLKVTTDPKTKQGILRSVPLAGSISVASDPIQNQALQNKILTDPKELAEHQFVVKQLAQTFKLMGAELNPIPECPEIKELPGIQHLQTPITGTLPPDHHILNCIAQLSPTAAVAGVPTDTALEVIAETETFNRGWYSGPVGWCRVSGEGHFSLALRSALYSQNTETESSTLALFAGAGIVADSDPKKELEEINLKFAAIKNLLT